MSTGVPRSRLEMPFLLNAGMVICVFFGLFGGAAAVFKALSLINPLTSASPGLRFKEALHDGTYIGIGVGIAIAVVGWGLWRERWWTRPVMLGVWLTGFASAVVQYARGITDASACASGLAGLAIAAWYLYGKGNVRAYFTALEERAARDDGLKHVSGRVA